MISYFFILYVLVAQSYLTLCNPMAHQTLLSMEFSRQRILELVTIPFSRGPSQPRDQTWVSHITGRFFTIWATNEALHIYCMLVCGLLVQCCSECSCVYFILYTWWGYICNIVMESLRMERRGHFIFGRFCIHLRQ